MREQQRTLAYGIVMLLPRLLRASMGVEPWTPPTRLPPVDAGAIDPVGPEVGTPAAKRPPPRKGSELGLTDAAMVRTGLEQWGGWGGGVTRGTFLCQSTVEGVWVMV